MSDISSTCTFLEDLIRIAEIMRDPPEIASDLPPELANWLKEHPYFEIMVHDTECLRSNLAPSDDAAVHFMGIPIIINPALADSEIVLVERIPSASRRHRSPQVYHITNLKE